MCGDGCDVVLVVSDYRLCSPLHLIKISKNHAACHSESCFLAPLNIKYALYSSAMVLRVQIKAAMLCSYRCYILTLHANSLEQHIL